MALIRDDLGVRDVVDLRSTAELKADGRGLLANESIRFHHVPLFDAETRSDDSRASGMNLADLYFFLAEFAKGPIARVIATLASAPAAAVYHCAAGKDRTGIVSALVLGLLDVDDEIIVADYVRSREFLAEIIERLMATEGYRAMFETLPPDTLHAEPETMSGFLARLRARYDSLHDYARSAGVCDEDIELLRKRMIE